MRPSTNLTALTNQPRVPERRAGPFCFYRSQSNVFSGKEGGSNIGGNQMSVRPVSVENSQKLNTIAESLQTFSLPNGRLLEMAEESFVPYFSDTSSYEDCLAEFRQKMELYIHE